MKSKRNEKAKKSFHFLRYNKIFNIARFRKNKSKGESKARG